MVAKSWTVHESEHQLWGATDTVDTNPSSGANDHLRVYRAERKRRKTREKKDTEGQARCAEYRR
jgi:hypothetical protein